MIKIAFFNNKGGVGKSTAAINVAHALSNMGKKVLVADCDNQRNTYRFFSAAPEENLIHVTRYENISITNRHTEKLEDMSDFEYKLLDLPPALASSKEILAQCDYVFVPIELGTFAIQGIANVTEAIATTGAKFGGCFINKFDRENPADHKLEELLRQTLGDKVMSTRIPYSRVIKNSISYNMTAFEYMGWTEAAEAFNSLTKEIIEITGGGDNA